MGAFNMPTRDGLKYGESVTKMVLLVLVKTVASMKGVGSDY